jgi:hypothetical protein
VIVLISPCELANTHGTGVQMLRLFGGRSRPFIHLHWASHSGLPSQSAASHWLREPSPWPWRTGRGFAGRFRDRFALTWWPRGVVNVGRFEGLLRGLPARPRVAYVVVCGEGDARRALSLLDVLGTPSVTHVVDLDRDELEPAAMPAFAELLRRSPRVLALNESIARQLERFRPASVEVVPFSCGYSGTAGPREDLIVLSGSLGPNPRNAHLHAAAEALRLVRVSRPSARAVYFGAHSRSLPPDLRSEVEDLGLVSDAACGEVLGRARLAYLLTPDGNSSWDRHSIPSRIADYLGCGLPILAMITRGNATHALLSEPALQPAVRFPTSAADLADATHEWIVDDTAWTAASAAAVAYANAHFSLDTVRSRIDAALAFVERTPYVRTVRS